VEWEKGTYTYDDRSRSTDRYARARDSLRERFRDESPPRRRYPPSKIIDDCVSAENFGEALLKFWDAFRNYSDPIKQYKLIELPAGVFILGNPLIGSSIYVRPCYPKLLEMSLSIVASEKHKTRHLIILGTSGIGKTYFGYFILLHLASAGATVVYESGTEASLYLFTPSSVKEGSRQDFLEYLRSPTTYYIVDAAQPLNVPAKTILITSNRREIWYQFSKTSCTLRYMPVWANKEVHICRSLMYPSLSEKFVENLYSKWGGIPRYVLSYALDKVQQALLYAALDTSNAITVLESFGDFSEESDALIHRSVTEDFRKGPS
jgi:hypothetical protein